MTMDRWRWRATLARSNEAVKPKLPRGWEPLDRSKLSQDCEGASSYGMFSNRD